MSFAETGLDPRLVRALGKRGLQKPTAVQLQAIPKTLEGKDVVARARTGSGKTLAYLLPALHRLLNGAAIGTVGGSFQAIVLVPTRELCEQVKSEALEVVQHCGVELQVTSLTAPSGTALKRAVSGAGHLVVATPGKIASAIKEGALMPSVLEQRLQTVVLDEADLLLSYGYDADLQLLAPLVPRSCQVVLMSATSSDAVEALQALMLHNPITLNLLGEGAAQGNGTQHGLAAGSGVSATINHWHLHCDPADKLLVIMTLLKLGLVRRKVLVFVNTVDQGYRVKLFLESFGVRAALLNAEMPLNSRSHCLASFNKGMFDYLIATDDVHAPTHDGDQPQSKKRRKSEADKGSRRRKGGPQKDEEFGVTRGIDFKGVRTVINYDLPSSLQGYVHRVGRTGRAGEEGSALTLVTPGDESFMEEVRQMLAPKAANGTVQHAGNGEAGDGLGDGVVSEEEEEQDGVGRGLAGTATGLQPFTRLSKAQLEALRYRAEDVARAITKKAVKEARAKELRAELLNNEKLKDYFESHEAERQLLRHDKALHKTPQAPQLKHLPAYLKDPSIITEATATGNRSPGQLSAQKRHKLPRTAVQKAEAAQGVTGADAAAVAAGSAIFGRGKEDPLKAVKGFVRAPKRGGHHEEEMTEMEKRAMEAGRKEAKKRAKAEGKPFVPKRNVRKFKRHR